MSSFVTEVLVSTGKLEKENLATKIGKLSRRVDEVKGEMFELVAKKFETFSPNLASSEALAAQVQGVCDDLNSLQTRVQQQDRPLRRRFVKDATGQLEAVALRQQRRAEERRSRQRAERRAAKARQVQREAQDAITEFSGLREQLERTNAVLCTVKQLHEVYQCLEGSMEAMGAQKYLLSARRLLNGQRAELRAQEELGQGVRILDALHAELLMQRENLINHLNDEWRQRVVWSLPLGKEASSVEQCLHTELCLLAPRGPAAEEAEAGDPPPAVFSTSSSSSLADVLTAYAALGLLRDKMRRFVEPLHSLVLRPLVVFPGLAVSTGDTTLRLVSSSTSSSSTKSSTESSTSSSAPSDPARTFTVLLQALTFVHQHMLVAPPSEPGVTDDADDDDYENGGDGGGGVAEAMGAILWEPLCETLIQHCLLPSVPSDNAGLQGYTQVISDTLSFERSLMLLGLLSRDSTALLEYARNVNDHFSGKKCRDGVTRARALMLAPLHDTVKVSDEWDAMCSGLPSSSAASTSSTTTTICVTAGNSGAAPGLADATLRAPRCLISRSVRELLQLVHGMLAEASISQGTCAAQLFYAVRNIFHLFCDIVPTCHRHTLQNFPQVAAVHHNNCMLLAHYLLTLGHQYHARLPVTLSEGTTTFVDLVPVFRKLGAEALLSQLRSQKAVLRESLGGARGFRGLEEEANYAAAQRSVKQVLLQLSRLGVVWQGVLPVNIYCKALGTILNTALTDVTAAIMALEDISSQDADRLHALCSEVAASAPLAFRPWGDDDAEETEREEEERRLRQRLPQHVTAWARFEELRRLLQGTLSDIVDRWADGKGPLAEELTANEVNLLVRALFQNTERRAAALAKIK